MKQSELDIHWLAGILDVYGEIGIKNGPSPTMFAKFKSIYPDRLEAIRDALGIENRLRGPFTPSGDSKRNYYELVLTGKELALLENLVTPVMRTMRRHLFERIRTTLRQLREAKGLISPFRICEV